MSVNPPKCPICEAKLPEGDAQGRPFEPFCSRRCRDIDLGRWLGESYRMPAVEPPEDFDEDDDPRTDTPT